jgi:uridine phosphorylase
MNNKQPHLKISAEDISPYVLLPGDPGRVEFIGNYLEEFKIIENNREYKIGVGYSKGRKITVCSTGIGCPSTAIAVHELINAGAKYLIRVGTCGGGWREDVELGDLVIPTASIRDEGTTQEYLPLGFPAVADFDIVSALTEASRSLNQKFNLGINRCHDSFYGSQEAIVRWGQYLKEEQWREDETPILSSEMESAALFVIASLKNVKAGAVLAVNAYPESLKSRIRGEKQKVVTEASSDLSKQVIGRMIEVALLGLGNF